MELLIKLGNLYIGCNSYLEPLVGDAARLKDDLSKILPLFFPKMQMKVKWNESGAKSEN